MLPLPHDLNQAIKSHSRSPIFVNFIEGLRAAGIPASFKEHLPLLVALDKDVIG